MGRKCSFWTSRYLNKFLIRRFLQTNTCRSMKYTLQFLLKKPNFFYKWHFAYLDREAGLDFCFILYTLYKVSWDALFAPRCPCFAGCTLWNLKTQNLQICHLSRGRILKTTYAMQIWEDRSLQICFWLLVSLGQFPVLTWAIEMCGNRVTSELEIFETTELWSFTNS